MSNEPTTAAEWIEQRINLIKFTANQYIRPFSGIQRRSDDWQEGALQLLFEELVQEGCLFLLEREHTFDPKRLDFGNFCYTMIQYGMKSFLYKKFTKTPPEVRIPLEDDYCPEYDVEVDCQHLKSVLKQLDPRKRLVLVGYLSGERGFLSNFARAEGISPQRAGQIRDEAIEEVKQLFQL